MRSEPWLFVTDLEGTLALFTREYMAQFQYPSVWQALAYALGPECFKREQDLTATWDRLRKHVQNDVRFRYRQFVDATARIHQEHRLTERLFSGVLESIPWIDGIEEAFAEIAESNGSIAIVTGGFANHAEHVPGRDYVRAIKAGCRYFFDERGALASWRSDNCDTHGKVAAIEAIIAKGRIAPYRCVFVGDGRNDTHIAKHVAGQGGLSIALNACDELKAVASIAIESPDYRTILDPAFKHLDKISIP